MQVLEFADSSAAADYAQESDHPLNCVCRDWEPDTIYAVFPSRDFKKIRKVDGRDQVIDMD